MSEVSDPVELMQSRIDSNVDRVEGDKAPCGWCGKMTPLDDLMCMTPTGDDPGACPDCVPDWVP